MPRKKEKKRKSQSKSNGSDNKSDKNGKGKNDTGSSKIARAAHSVVMDLADLLKSVLNSGLVAVGDVNLKIADVELPIKLRLLVTMIEKAREEGINWWENDSFYSVKKQDKDSSKSKKSNNRRSRRKK